jgi:hypothetical protein
MERRSSTAAPVLPPPGAPMMTNRPLATRLYSAARSAAEPVNATVPVSLTGWLDVAHWAG